MIKASLRLYVMKNLTVYDVCDIVNVINKL